MLENKHYALYPYMIYRTKGLEIRYLLKFPPNTPQSRLWSYQKVSAD